MADASILRGLRDGRGHSDRAACRDAKEDAASDGEHASEPDALSSSSAGNTSRRKDKPTTWHERAHKPSEIAASILLSGFRWQAVENEYGI